MSADVQTQMIQMLKNQKNIMSNQKVLLKQIKKRYDPSASDANSALHCHIDLITMTTEQRIAETTILLADLKESK